MNNELIVKTICAYIGYSSHTHMWEKHKKLIPLIAYSYNKKDTKIKQTLAIISNNSTNLFLYKQMEIRANQNESNSWLIRDI